MSELRKDPISRRWVIISDDRAKKLEPPEPRAKEKKGFCPFCEGNEESTPPEIVAYRDNGSSKNGTGWRVRVVPNKFPAVQVEGILNKQGLGLYDAMNGIGAHEIIIDTPKHGVEIFDLSHDEVKGVLSAYRDRFQDLKKDKRFRYISIFKNSGTSAGALLEHAHTQLIATPVVPHNILEKLEGAREHFENRERCVYCDLIVQELLDGKRTIMENNHFVAVAPFASRFPFEVWILPKAHAARFEDIPENEVDFLATMLTGILTRMNKSLDFPAFNYIFHSEPFVEKASEYFHWHLEIVPRLSPISIFELGSGFFINQIAPETVAQYLKGVKV